MRLSAVIIAMNEEENLPRCLESIGWIDEIIIIDSGSSDKTRSIAEQAGARVYDIKWNGFGPAKQYGVSMAAGNWILSIDADEEVSPELAAEIRHIIKDGPKYDGYYIPRRTMFLGRWVSHCGWYPDRVLRLFDKSRGNFNQSSVHEKVILDGKSGHLQGELRHYSYPTLKHYLKKFNRYTTLGAEEAFRLGKKASWFDMAVRPPATFFKHYIAKQGFRDGWEGFVISMLSSMAVLVKYAKLRELKQRNTGRKG
jgi:glycosyltransferase involved in cell wall biosynthesis